jgi:hypothetical protein
MMSKVNFLLYSTTWLALYLVGETARVGGCDHDSYVVYPSLSLV